jgi:beta-phosphoglucomutase-like phosphatase (HAD superfamily)
VDDSKPNPDIYLKAAKLLKTDPEFCLALEDSENGVRAAISAGMTVIQIPDMIIPSEKFKKLGHAVLDNLNEVLELFNNSTFVNKKRSDN